MPELIKILCPHCKEGLMVVRSTVRKTERTKYFPNGRPLGVIRRYRYCDKCGYPMRTTHRLETD